MSAILDDPDIHCDAEGGKAGPAPGSLAMLLHDSDYAMTV